MELKTSSSKVFALLSACLPNDQTVQKRLIVDNILELPEYRMILALPCYPVLEKYYGLDALMNCSLSALKSMDKIVAFIPNLVMHLENAVQYGEAWKLTSRDEPDWYSLRSLESLDGKLTTDTYAENVTNLTSATILDVFSDKVVKKPDTVLEKWTVQDCDQIDQALTNYHVEKQYCLPRKVFELQKEYCDKMDSLVAKARNIRKSSRRMRIIDKTLFIVAVLLLAFLIPLVTDMPGEGIFVFYVLSIVLSIGYAIKG